MRSIGAAHPAGRRGRRELSEWRFNIGQTGSVTVLLWQRSGGEEEDEEVNKVTCGLVTGLINLIK